MKYLSLCVLGALCVLCGFLESACGYSLVGRGAFLPAYIKTIGVPMFANRTTVFSLETQLTEKVRTEFISRGKYQIVPDQTNVDAVLTGEIISAREDTSSLNAQTNIANEKIITVTARVELRDIRDNKVIWQNPNMVFRQNYAAQSGTTSTDPNAFFQQDANALERLSGDFARAIVSAILEAF